MYQVEHKTIITADHRAIWRTVVYEQQAGRAFRRLFFDNERLPIDTAIERAQAAWASLDSKEDQS